MIKLIDIMILKPHESINEERVNEIANLIINEGLWKHPIVIDNKTKIIMDGHHRYHAAKKLGLISIPCWLLSYDDAYLNVLSWKTGESFDIKGIIDVVDKGTLYPPKTTRHIITREIEFQPILIKKLRKGLSHEF
ncbi:hypothetical protein HVA01_01870 [Halovibrio variabilis]|uniref:ParB-like N-terminal domain-containing protein n=1 Tax=Halovibrio variabilis TaxID=31910 RepID=A0A511UKB2_9GAMM|nr:ParB N-terminal domain-containing protein [Halovibrio variabilis]GEN26541.1 hypothetical protein HVA01_01870 [Halovibrio variabilis]